LTSDDLFTPIFVPAAVQDAVSGAAWLRAMLDVEAALARAEAAEGVIPDGAAAAIAAASPDLSGLAVAARGAGNPVVPLVKALRAAAGDDAARWVHFGATSQDVLDSAAMLVSRRALGQVLEELDAVVDDCARLAREHRDTLMVGRTLLQQALPVTFGLKAAGWLAGVAGARERLRELLKSLPAQLGGASGTLASLGERGAAVLERFAERLELVSPRVPWHGDRRPVAELGAALAIAAGAVEKVALDVVLLAQTEVGEVAEASGDGRGSSSTMPHKRNPVGAIRARAGARSVRAAAGVLLEAMAGEHERAAGAWHSEWTALSAALAGTGGAAWALHEGLSGLRVDAERMRANLDATGGLLLAEHVALLAGDKDAVQAAVERAAADGRPLADVLRGDPAISLTDAEIARALDPAHYLGAADTFIDRALELV
jgi:3-carboxy-cis,cis-muconate cycloisomerase